AARAAPPHRHPDGERLRGARALGRLEHLPRGAVGPVARAHDDGHQTGRAWRAPGRCRVGLQGPRLPAAGGVRSHRGRRRLRGRLHGLPGEERRPLAREPAPRHGVRRGHGVLRGREVRHPGVRVRHARRRAGARAGVHDTVGEDLVNHCVNDVLVHGARPLAFLDYIATGTLEPAVAAALVDGVARACRAHEMTLAGGETAQLPDLYQPGHYDLAGTIVGVVEERDALHGDRVRPGDVLLGYASTGLHTNGYTLARRIVFETLGLDLDAEFPDTGRSVAQVLLDVHRSYAAAVTPVLSRVHA